MSEKLELTDERLAEALRCCTKSEAAACRKCPMGLQEQDGKCCFDALRLMAAERIGALAEENRRLRDATEGYTKELVQRMVTLAREGNTAGARGLEKVSGDLVLELNEIQDKLVKLGRESVVRAEPVAGQGWRVTLITVEGREVYKTEGGADAESG